MKSVRFLFSAFLFGFLLWSNTGSLLDSSSHLVQAQDTDTSSESSDRCSPGDASCTELLAPFPGQSRRFATGEGTGEDFVPYSAVEIMGHYVSSVFKFGIGFVSVFSVIMLMVGGYEWMTAGGDSGNTENAKKRIEQALFGLVLVFLSALILNFVNPNFFKLL